MELRRYWKIIRRWWWLAAVPALVVTGCALGSHRAPAPTYTTAIRFTASQTGAAASASAEATPRPSFDPNYYRWLTSEYIVNGLADWVRTGSFAEIVSRRLASRGLEIPAAAVQGAIGADNVRSVLVLYLSWPDGDQLRVIGMAAAYALENRAGEAFPQFGGDPVRVVALDSPASVGIGQAPPSLRARLDLPLKVGLGFAAGLALALVAHYLDPYLRDRDEVEAAGYRVVGEIPGRG